ncbi:MAG: amidohydrolase family protein [Oceanospirillaceae bacterium]|nr:amidohydrolase family protein [Oceanospirillaceae bacterium]
MRIINKIILTLSLAALANTAYSSSDLLPNGELGVIDTHMHLWDIAVSAEDKTWPGTLKTVDWLYRDVTMSDFNATRGSRQVTGMIMVEALGPKMLSDETIRNHNEWLFSQAIEHDKIIGIVAKLNPVSADFDSDLRKLLNQPYFVGIRLKNRDMFKRDADKKYTIWQEGVIDNLKILARFGKVLDLQGNGDEAALIAQTVPDLNIVINHRGGKAGNFNVEKPWLQSLDAIAPYPNVYMKVSDIQRQSMQASGGKWPNPVDALQDPTKYAATLEALFSTLGEDRLVFGSNWPVSNLMNKSGDWVEQLDILENYIRTHFPNPAAVRQKVVHDNALKAYRLR